MKGLLSSMIIKAVFPQMMALGAYPWDSHQATSFGEAFFGSIQRSLFEWETVFPYPIGSMYCLFAIYLHLPLIQM